MRILVVDDNRELAQSVASGLTSEAYAVDLAHDGPTADELVSINPYDLVVLDWSIPPPSGLELLRAWRRQGLTMPVLMLTGRTDVADRVNGLDTGADDYLTKPFSFPELLARVRSLLRRRDRPLEPELRAGDLVMDRATRRVTVGGETLELTRQQFALLEYLLRHKDEVVTRTDLADHVWDGSLDSFSNLVDVAVHRLRQKIDGERDKRLLHTIKGAGYVLRSERT
ncbi:MAG: two-component system, OmpR family, copper resistance phosphate regulon response regulator CusR [Acidobacteriota bacterium]|nr:two-component system, OmpR family, copper resistance phosphate regulon response regulator CusR [Acidobacteriota bacterium]